MATRSMDFPGNSNTEKVKKKKEEEEKPVKKIEKVVEGTVVQRKRGWLRRVQDAMTGDDAQTVGSYILYEVAIPAFRDLIFDIIRNGAERSLYGEIRPSRGSGRGLGLGRNNAVNYGSMSRVGRGSDRDDRGDRRELSSRARRNHDFGEIVIPDRGEAEEVIDRLVDLIDRFGIATVSDLLELVGVSTDHADERWGWYNLASARAVRTRDGYLLDLPRTEPIE